MTISEECINGNCAGCPDLRHNTRICECPCHTYADYILIQHHKSGGTGTISYNWPGTPLPKALWDGVLWFETMPIAEYSPAKELTRYDDKE